MVLTCQAWRLGLPLPAGERLLTVGHGFVLPALNVGVPEMKLDGVVWFDVVGPDRAEEVVLAGRFQDHTQMRGGMVSVSARARR